jgi:hypothetical protein
MRNLQGPDFVCIGAQKAGTTWLYENLRGHPDVWMPPVKEFHYFDRARINEELLGDWDMPHPDGIYNRYIKNRFPPNLNNIRWLRHYYRYGYSKKMYLSLFDEKYTMGKVCGDITPGYSTLDDSGVRYAQKVLGSETTIIFILRNPIERSWSAAKMMFRYYNKDYGSGDYAEIYALLKKPHITLCSDYANIISRWQDYFQNMRLLTYDRLCESPFDFLGDISSLLKIRNQWDSEAMGKRVWSDEKDSPIPASIYELLREQYYHNMEELYSLTGIPEVKKWLSAAGSV